MHNTSTHSLHTTKKVSENYLPAKSHLELTNGNRDFKIYDSEVEKNVNSNMSQIFHISLLFYSAVLVDERVVDLKLPNNLLLTLPELISFIMSSV